MSPARLTDRMAFSRRLPLGVLLTLACILNAAGSKLPDCTLLAGSNPVDPWLWLSSDCLGDSEESLPPLRASRESDKLF